MPVLNKEQKRKLLSLNKDTITVSEISKIFGYTKKPSKPGEKRTFEVNPPEIPPGYKVHLDAGEYINKEAVDTNAGIFLFNKLFIEGNLEGIIENGYYNEVLTAKKFKNLMTIIANAVMTDKIPTEPNLVTFLKAYEFWSLKLAPIFTPSYTMSMISPGEELEKRKAAARKAQSEAKTNEEMIKIEDQLVADAKKLTANDPGQTIFNSGARGSFDNDYKNMMLSVGAVMNPTTGEFDQLASSYIEGIKKEEIIPAANQVINAEYPKAINTAVSGYESKKFYAVFQTIILDDPNTDCGTKEGIITTLTEDNYEDFIDQYAFGKNGFVLITLDNKKELINRKIKIRSPLFCKNDCICNKCAGERFYKLGIKNMGLVAPIITGRLLNAGMSECA